MDPLTLALLVLCSVLTIIVVTLLWRGFHPAIPFEIRRRPVAIIEPPRPTHVKCNTRRWTFGRTIDGTPETDSYEAHPYCAGLPMDLLTEDYGRQKFMLEHPNQDGWALTAVADQVHFVKL